MADRGRQLLQVPRRDRLGVSRACVAQRQPEDEPGSDRDCNDCTGAEGDHTARSARLRLGTGLLAHALKSSPIPGNFASVSLSYRRKPKIYLTILSLE